MLRDRHRFFDRVGHETMYASSGNKQSITDGVHRNEHFVEIIPVFSSFSNFFKSEDIIQGGTLFKGGH